MTEYSDDDVTRHTDLKRRYLAGESLHKILVGLLREGEEVPIPGVNLTVLGIQKDPNSNTHSSLVVVRWHCHGDLVDDEGNPVTETVRMVSLQYRINKGKRTRCRSCASKLGNAARRDINRSSAEVSLEARFREIHCLWVSPTLQPPKGWMPR